MKNILIILISSMMSLSHLCCSQARQLSRNIEGYYEFIDSSGLAGSSLVLDKSENYTYQTGTDLHVQHSNGKWAMKGDTLLLNSETKQNNIPVIVNEVHQDSIKDNIVISLVEDLDKEIMDAVFMFNGDTSSLCIPLFETGCDHKIGSIDSFRVGFSSKIYTPWIKLKSKRTNLIEVKAQVHISAAQDLVFTDEKFLYKDGTLQRIVSDKNNTFSKGIILKRVKH